MLRNMARVPVRVSMRPFTDIVSGSEKADGPQYSSEQGFELQPAPTRFTIR